MQFLFSRRPNPQVVEEKILNLPPSVYDDPAFSSDPRSHPYYVTGHETKWALPPAPGHPTLKARRRQRLVSTININDNSPSDSDSELQLLQPPNSPMYPDRNNDTHPPFASPHDNPFFSPTGTISTPTAPKSPPSAVPMAIVSTEALDAAQKTDKKRTGLLTRWKSSKQVESETSKLKPSQSQRRDNNASARTPSRVGLLRRKSAPEPHREETARPDLSIRSVTAPAKPESAVSDARNPRTHPPVNDLDRIDELDESNLFGVSLHHGGPYEAVRAVAGGGSQMPLGYLNNGRLHAYHNHVMQTVGHVYMPPEAPIGVPLNLSPGQILPRNFRRQQSKPPRLRNNLVSPLPAEQPPLKPVENAATPPRHSNFNQTPFHKNTRSQNQRQHQIPENPLDGPPIDPSVYIGLAMLQVDMSQSTTFRRVSPELEGVKDEEDEFNPYDPIHLEGTPGIQGASTFEHFASAPSVHSSPSPDSHTRFDQGHIQEELQSSIENAGGDAVHSRPASRPLSTHSSASEKLGDPVPLSRSPSLDSPTSRPKASEQERNMASEETLVQNEEHDINAAKPFDFHPSHEGDNGTTRQSEAFDAIIKEQRSSQTPIIDIDAEPESAEASRDGSQSEGKPLLQSPPPEPVQEELSIVHPKPSEEQTTMGGLSPSQSRARPMEKAPLEKQLPPYPPSAGLDELPPQYSATQVRTDGSPEVSQQEFTTTQIIRKDNSNAIVQKLLQRSDTRTTTRSSGSNRSYSSTKGDDGHSSVNSGFNSSVPPQHFFAPLMPYPHPSQSSDRATPYILGGAHSGQPELNNRNLVKHLHSPHKLSTNEQRRGNGVVQRALQRGSSNGSSNRSSQLSPIEEDIDQPIQSSKFSSSLSGDVMQPPRKENSGQRSMPHRVEVGHIYHHSIPMNNGRPSEATHQQLQAGQNAQSQYTPASSYDIQRQEGAPLQYPSTPPSSEKSRMKALNQNLATRGSDNTTDGMQITEQRPLRVLNMLSHVPEVDEGGNMHHETTKEHHLREQHYQAEFRPPGSPSPTRNLNTLNQVSKPQSVNTHSASRNMRPPQPHYLPKKLVMPTPLQPQNPPPISSHARPVIYPLRPNEYYQYVSPSSLQPLNPPRSPSPPDVLPPILSQQQGTKMDPGGRKLKKRTSWVPPPSAKAHDLPPTAALSFSPVIITPVSTEKPIARPKASNEKAAKRVLSKKRTNL